jgi:hypothetical protein
MLFNNCSLGTNKFSGKSMYTLGSKTILRDLVAIPSKRERNLNIETYVAKYH